MSAARGTQKLIAVCALFVWLHLALSIYPLPPQAAAEFEASLQHDSATKTPSDAGSRAKPPKGAVRDRDLEVEFWFNWITNAILLLVGVCASVLTYRNYRHWKVALLLPSIYIGYVTISPIVVDIIERGGLIPWFELWRSVSLSLMGKGETRLLVSSIYNFFVWPLYHVAIVLVVSYVWLRGSYGGRQRRESA